MSLSTFAAPGLGLSALSTLLPLFAASVRADDYGPAVGDAQSLNYMRPAQTCQSPTDGCCNIITGAPSPWDPWARDWARIQTSPGTSNPYPYHYAAQFQVRFNASYRHPAYPGLDRWMEIVIPASVDNPDVMDGAVGRFVVPVECEDPEAFRCYDLTDPELRKSPSGGVVDTSAPEGLGLLMDGFEHGIARRDGAGSGERSEDLRIHDTTPPRRNGTGRVQKARGAKRGLFDALLEVHAGNYCKVHDPDALDMYDNLWVRFDGVMLNAMSQADCERVVAGPAILDPIHSVTCGF